MSGRGRKGDRLVTWADLEELLEKLRRRFEGVDSRIGDTERSLDKLDRHVRPYGDGAPDIDLGRWDRRVNRDRQRRRR